MIARSGKPVVRLVAVEKPRTRREPGSARGRIRVSKDFDAPLPEEFREPFE